MNKRYIDFVPVNKARTAKDERASAEPQVVATEVSEFEINEIFEAKSAKAGVSTGRKEPKFGVIEDFKPKFVKTEVEKRPLSNPETAKKKAAELKAKKIAKMSVMSKKAAPKEAAVNSEVATSKAEKESLKIPKSPFVNTEKVAKRPLSKNVYQKKIVELTEEPTGPVTIINKPEKDSKGGIVIAIIITIILGAAAGTVAFLLLPK